MGFQACAAWRFVDGMRIQSMDADVDDCDTLHETGGDAAVANKQGDAIRCRINIATAGGQG